MFVYGFEQDNNKSLRKEVVAVKQITPNAKMRHSEYYGTQEIFDMLYEQSKNGNVFKGELMSFITSKENILLAYRNIKQNAGSKTPGIDNKTIEQVGKLTEEVLVNKIRGMLRKYKPKPVKRVEIPKGDGKVRPLGIPTIFDRIIQQAILQVLEPICEAKFYEQSFGFRPGRSTENAIANAGKRIQLQKCLYVVNVDIKGFFDNVDHDKLIRQMWTLGIRDKKLICIIKAMLKAKIQMPDGTLTTPVKGTPQGGILSPLLANIVLNELDWWVVSNWQDVKTERNYSKTTQHNGQITEHHKYEQLRKTTKLKEMWITRYADDFKIFCKTQEDAERTFLAVKDWLAKRLHLEVQMEKSGVTDLTKDSMTFLGFEFRAVKRGTQYVVQSRISSKARKAILSKLKEQIKRMQRPRNNADFIQAANQYNKIVIGVHNYYKFATMTSYDFGIIANSITKVLHNRIGAKLTKVGIINNAVYKKLYGKSKQVRFIDNMPLLPIGYVQHKNPMAKQYGATPYTVLGREKMHKALQMDMKEVWKMMENPIPSQTPEYNDNRLSKFVAQKGKCSVTGVVLTSENAHCHHIEPKEYGGTDKFSNLAIVLDEIHILIHATSEDTINKYIHHIQTSEQLEKLNALRIKAHNTPIKANN